MEESFYNDKKELSQIERKFYELITAALRESHDEAIVYDLEYLNGSKLLRVFIMDPNTKSATLDDCVRVDRLLDDPFETQDWIPEEVVLEVSSPGIYRHIRTLDHLNMSVGERVKCKVLSSCIDSTFRKKWKKSLEGNNVIGVLTQAFPADKALELECTSVGEKLVLPFEAISKLHCEPEI